MRWISLAFIVDKLVIMARFTEVLHQHTSSAILLLIGIEHTQKLVTLSCFTHSFNPRYRMCTTNSGHTFSTADQVWAQSNNLMHPPGMSLEKEIDQAQRARSTAKRVYLQYIVQIVILILAICAAHLASEQQQALIST